MANGDTPPSGTLSVAPGATDHHVALPPEIALIVVVREVAGGPIEGANVTVRVSRSSTVGTMRTDPAGIAETRLSPNGEVRVDATATGFGGTATTVPIPPGATEVYVTLRLTYVAPATPAHMFAWQNAHLRDALYRVGAHDPLDPGHEGDPPGDAQAGRDRHARLVDFCMLLGRYIRPAPSSDAIAGARAEAARLEAIDARLAAMQTTPTADHDDALRADEAAIQSAAAPAASTASPATTAAPAHRTSAQQARAITAARRGVADLLESSLTAATHRELLEHVLDIFDSDSALALPKWLRYMVVHFTGLRYINSHNSMYPADWASKNLRIAEINAQPPYESAPHEFDGASEERIRRLLGEARALLGPGGLSASTGARSPHGLMDLLNSVDPPAGSTPTPTGHGAPRAPADAAAKIAALKTLHVAFTTQWTDGANADDALLSLLYRYEHTARPLPAALKSLLKRVTLLRINQVREAWDESDLISAGEANGIVASRGDWAHIFADSYQSAWKDRMEANRVPAPWGAECNQISEIASAVRGTRNDEGLTQTSMRTAFVTARGDHFAPADLPRTLGPYVLRRPAPPPPPPPPDASAGGSTTPDAAAPAEGTPTPTPDGAAPPPAPSATPALDNHKLWHFRSVTEVEQGDQFLMIRWVRVHETHDRPSNWVYTTVDAELKTPTYRSSDTTTRYTGILRPQADLERYRRAHHRDPAPESINQHQLDAYRAQNGGADPPGLQSREVLAAATGPIETIENPDHLEAVVHEESELQGGDVELHPAGSGELAGLPMYKKVNHPRYGFSIVRRHPRSRTYNEVLVFSHEGTVLAVLPGGMNRLITFETCAPTGVFSRSLTAECEWRMLYVRHPPPTEPPLDRFLQRENLLDRARLDD